MTRPAADGTGVLYLRDRMRPQRPPLNAVAPAEAVVRGSPRRPVGEIAGGDRRPQRAAGDAHTAAGTPGEGSSGASSRPSHAKQPWRVLIIIGLAQLMVVLDTTIVNIALPCAQMDLGFGTDGG